jgi:hypothetical protein
MTGASGATGASSAPSVVGPRVGGLSSRLLEHAAKAASETTSGAAIKRRRWFRFTVATAF